MIDPETSEFRGYLRNRHHCAIKPRFEAKTQRRELLVSTLAQLHVHPVDGTPWLLCSWGIASVDPSSSLHRGKVCR